MLDPDPESGIWNQISDPDLLQDKSLDTDLPVVSCRPESQCCESESFDLSGSASLPETRAGIHGRTFTIRL